MPSKLILTNNICQKARLSRDPRFDGLFFTAVKTTMIYCRSICPVSPPKEANVSYYFSASAAAQAGYRPCLRCRPESAPNSPAWQGAKTTFSRALQLIDQGALQHGSLTQLSARLGITDRYLRKLFNQHLGVAPKAYALYQQCLFAKQLLHQTNLPITQVAFASGFSSVRRFNDCFKKQLNLAPSQIRKSEPVHTNALQLQLSYRPPYDWPLIHNFLMTRAIPELEWCDNQCYGRTFNWSGTTGCFTARHNELNNRFDVTLKLSDTANLKSIVNNIRRILDLNLDPQAVESDLQQSLNAIMPFRAGLRLPGIWAVFEAGIRAILGQQISVTAARNLVITLVNTLGKPVSDELALPSDTKRLFPTPEAIANNDLNFLKIPNSRKQTLRNLAQHYLINDDPDNPQLWLKLKGIGPWTVDYARLRGLSNPDIFLGGDLGVKKAIEKAGGQSTANFNPKQAAPWRSYLTFQLWNQL